ncbi:MAG: rod shape-determining protein MreC [Rickettsiaceae bacterium]|nr:rod shape-determining protein MreC [Rickettsiaceae bacterium]
MAILENRYKNGPQLVLRSFLAVPEFLRRFSAFVFLLISIQLLYFQPSYLSTIALEYSSYPINLGSTICTFLIDKSSGFVNFFIDINDIRVKNLKMKHELNRLQSIEVDFIALQKENEALRGALKMQTAITYKSIPAKLLSVSMGPYSMSAILAAGSSEGVSEGKAVVVDGAIVGRIYEVSEHHSKLRLINDISSRISVISSDSRMRAILAGSNQGNLRLLYVADKSMPKVGEILVSSGDGKYFPEGFKLAKITEISDDSIFAAPIIDIGKIDFVHILE